MSTLRRFDSWLGKNVFVPPIIAFCHATRQNQHEAAGCFSVFAFLLACWEISSSGPGFLDYIFIMLFAFIAYDYYQRIFVRGLPHRAHFFFRVVSGAMILFNLIPWLILVFLGDVTDVYGIIFWTLLLAAEYAGGIGTLPPRKKRQKKGHAKPAHSNA